MQTDGVHHIIRIARHKDDIRVGIDDLDAVRELDPRHVVHLNIAEYDVGFYRAALQRLKRLQLIAEQIYFRVRLDLFYGVR